MDDKKKKKIEWEIISSYTAKEAEEDGILVRVHDAHFSHITRRVWDECIDPFIIKWFDGSVMRIPGMKNSYRDMTRKLLNRVKENIACQIIVGSAKPGDWFYKVRASGWEFFVEQNETGKYTLFFPDEH